MIAIIGAMQPEVDALLALSTENNTRVISNHTFVVGKLSQTDVVIALSGVAKVAAATTTTILLEHFDVDGIINIGTAGGLLKDQKVLDVVVSTRVAHHDADLTAFGIAKGFDSDRFAYNSDPHFVSIVEQALGEGEEAFKVWVGPMVSGDQFIASKQQVEAILKDFPTAMCCEMEAAAIAQVATIYQVPFVVIRSLSDITLRDDNHLSFEEYLPLASKRSAQWVYKIIDQLKESTKKPV